MSYPRQDPGSAYSRQTGSDYTTPGYGTSDYGQRQGGYPWAAGPPYAPSQRPAPEQSDHGPRHGDPRDFQRPVTMGRPGFDAPRAGRGAHSRPDNPVRPSYEDPRPYGGYPDSRPRPDVGGYGRSDTRVPGYIDRRSDPRDHGEREPDRHEAYPPRQRPRPPASGPAYPDYASPAPAHPASGPAYSASGPAYSASGPAYSASGPAYPGSAPAYPSSAPAHPTSSPAYQMSAPAHHGAPAGRPASYAGAGYARQGGAQYGGGYTPTTYYEPERDHTGRAPTSGPAAPQWDGHPSLDPRQVPPYRSGEGFTDGQGRRAPSDLLTRSAEQRIYRPPPRNGPAIAGLVFGFTPLCGLAIIFGIIGLVKAPALKVGRGMAIAAIILGLAWTPVDYLAARHFVGTTKGSASSTHQPTPAPSGVSPSGTGDAGCVLAETSAGNFNKALQADANNAAKLITDFKNAAGSFNSAAAKETDPTAASAMRKFAGDLQSIYTSLSKHQTPSTTVMNRLGTDGNAVDKACGH